MLEDLEELWLRPLKIVDHEDQGTIYCQSFEQHSDRP